MAERKRRGFAGMDRDKQREIASKGGQAAHRKGTAHRFSAEEARQAGRKGGQAAHVKGTAHEFTSEEARIAGRKGGQAARGRHSRKDGTQEVAHSNGAAATATAEFESPNGEPEYQPVGSPST